MFLVKSSDSIGELPKKLSGLNAGGESGILSVRVKSVDIERNTSGVGDFLDCY